MKQWLDLAQKAVKELSTIRELLTELVAEAKERR